MPLVALGLAIALAGCQQATPIDEPEPDTAPKFTGTVGPQTYKALQDIDTLTLPRATGGNGDLRYTLEGDLPTGLSFDKRTRRLTGRPSDDVYEMTDLTYRVEDSDDNSSTADSDTLEFTITIQPKTILEDVVSTVTVGEAPGRLKFEPLPAANGGPAISVSGSNTIVAGGAFFLDVVPASSAVVDTLLISVRGESTGYYEIDLEGATSSYRLVGLVPYDLDRTRSSLRLCVAAVYAIDRVGAPECHTMEIADVLTGDSPEPPPRALVQVTLSWDADSDVDLQVLDPNGEEVERAAVNGAAEPVTDSNDRCDLEGTPVDGIRNAHVALPAGRNDTPPGVYAVRVHYQASCGVFETNYVLRVNQGGDTSTFSGKLTGPGDYAVDITTFTVSGAADPPEIRTPEPLEYEGGDAVFVLNPNGEILDDTAYTLRLGDASADVYLIATNTAYHPMDPRVARLDRRAAAGRFAPAANEALAQRTASGHSMVPQRSWVTEFNNDSPPPDGACMPQQTQTRVAEVGDTFTFRDLDESQELVEIPATARKVVRDATTTLAVWVADNDWERCAACVRPEMVDTVADRFLKPDTRDDIYDLVTAIFGEPWGSDAPPCTIPAQSAAELHILLYDIDDDGIAGEGDRKPRSRGYFAAKDNYLPYPHHAVTKSSNARLILYLDAPLLAQFDGPSWDVTDYWPRQMISTLVHELQHMIHFYQKRVKQGARSEVWLNEMASEVAEDLIVDKLEIDGLYGPRAVVYDNPTAGDPQNLRGRLPLYNLHNDIQVTTWDGTLRRASINYALGAYLARTYGGAALFSGIVQSEREGVDAIETALRAQGHMVSFADVLVNWAVANLLSDNLSAPHPYRYNPGIWSTSRVGGVTFLLGSINLYHYRYESFSQEGPFLYSLEGFNERTQPRHSNMYATLGRNTGTVRLRVNAVRDNRITVVVKE